MKNYYYKVFFEKCRFIADINFFCSNCEQEYYDEECINLFLEILKK